MQSIFLPGLALLLSLTSTTLAQENGELGRMWAFENPPLAYLENEYEFKPDQKWLDSLRLGSLRLGGEEIQSGFGSASFVSPQGLIMTSHRCVRDAVAASSDPAARARGKEPLGIIKTGFVAATRKEEIRLRTKRTGWLTAAQLVEISNVTDRVNRGVAPTDNELQIQKKREANKKTILDAARQADPELVPQIVSLHQGAVVRLYQYKVYDDIRLVCIPHLQTANFGGDADNFTYPRHSLDFAFLRAYENGKPADTTRHYFKWKSGGAREDELVFVSGNPGKTSRLFTKAQLECERDIRIPMRIEWLTNRLRVYYTEYFEVLLSQQSTVTFLLGLESGLKAARANLHGLEDAQLMGQKTAAEQAFRNRVMADEELAKKCGDIWDRIAGVIQKRRQHEARAHFHSTGHMAPLSMAVTVVQSCDPATTEEHRKQANEKLEGWGTSGFPNNVAYALFQDHVVRARNWLPQDGPYLTKALGGKSGAEFFGGNAVHSLVPYAEQRNALVQSGWKAIQDCEDPAIVFARELVILMRENKKLGDELDAKEEALGAELGRVLLRCYGKEIGPDGTTTPRFTDGVVRGFPSGDTIAPHRTTFYGLYARSAKSGGGPPLNLPQIWLDRKDKIDMTKSVNFVSTNDITCSDMTLETNSIEGHRWRDSGGSSGSVVVNKELEVIGVVVDATTEALANDFVFRDGRSRTVSTHVDGIMESLVKIYAAHHIAEELAGK